LVELLAAAYLVNGGLVFKHEDSLEDEDDDADYSRLLEEIDELNFKPTKTEVKAHGLDILP
jgi:hypothetical protein